MGYIMSVDKNLIDELIVFLKKYDCIEKVVLFGSRARGDNTERSDYDIAIYGKVSASVQGEIRYYCSEVLRTLHKIDLVFVSEKTYAKLKENIETEGTVLYGKD